MNRSHPAATSADRTPRSCAAFASDPFVAARADHWRRSTCDPPGWRAPHPNLLAELVQAEYRPDGGTDGPPTLASRRDMALARLRHRMRSANVPPPLECIRLLAGGALTGAAVFDAWPYAVRRHGPRSASAALEHGLRKARDPDSVRFLLDLAASSRLRPLTEAQLLALSVGRHRAVRHAAWRLIAAYDRIHLLPTRAEHQEDPYERLLKGALRNVPLQGADAVALPPGILVAQSMLVGQLDRPGEGLSGGLSVLLGSLGDALAQTGRVAGVITVVTASRPELEADPVLLLRRANGHWILRLPVDSPRRVRPEEMGSHREAMAWWAAKLFAMLGRSIDVLHVRYADDGSLAVAEAARRAGLGLVFTATPDPHRQITERHDVAGAEPNSLRHDLHRVFLADRLIQRADLVLGIAAGDEGSTGLRSYFPQLSDLAGKGPVRTTPEGIPPYRPPSNEVRRRRQLLAGIDAIALADPARIPTVLLSVGRLHPVKQQDLLVRSWVDSGCCEKSVLVLVGGSPPKDEDAVERSMRDRIGEAVASSPEARKRLLLLPALSNAEVRLLEHSLADPARRIRARYVCPSAKEEFGLAVLEAMEAGLMVAGPKRGGVSHYLVDGTNGLLLDTSNSRTLGEGLRRLVSIDDEKADAMARRAQKLVRSTYSSTAMAQALADHYASVPREADCGTGGHRRALQSPSHVRS